MRCPFCKNIDTQVIDSRAAGDSNQTRRRRTCGNCEQRFTTYEVAELSLPSIVKANKQRETFKEDKLRSGILQAIEKSSITLQQVDAIIANIKHKLYVNGEREVESMKVGDLVMEQLRGVDQVAYIRFASVHKKFSDVRIFLEEIERLENEMPPEFKVNQLTFLDADDGDEN